MIRKILPLSLLSLLLTVSHICAEPKATCEVTKSAQHDLLVTFSWKLTVTSDKDWQA